MFLKKKNKPDSPADKKGKNWKKIAWITALALFVICASYAAYLYASGKRMFDAGSLTASPFFKKISGQQYTLKGEGDGRINVLFLGMGGSNHPGGQLTDSIMVLSIDPENKTMAMLSIPRDLYVPIPGTKYSRKINEVYKTGEDKKKDGGGEFAKETIGKILDLPIHYYVTVDFFGFKKLVDEVGGLDLNVEKSLYDPYYPDDNMIGYAPLSIKKGQQHMDGTLALKYARSRETTSDFDRAARQQQVISAIRQKIFDKGYLANPKKVLDIVNIVGDHVRTDFTPEETMAMAKLFKDLDFSKTVSKVLTNASDGELVSDSSSGTYTLMPKGGSWEQIQRIAHEIFTDPDLVKEKAGIEIANCSKTAGVGSKLSETLKSYNYTVVSLVTGKPNPKTAIYDYSNGSKPTTISFLEKRLNVKAVKTAKGSAVPSDVDISIQIGDDYKGFAKDPTSTSTSATSNK